MPRIEVDLTDVEPDSGGGFRANILPPDRSPYILQVTGVQNQKSRNDNPMLVFDFIVLEPQDLADETLRQWIVLTNSRSLGRLRALANVCNVVYDRQGLNYDEFIDAVFECDMEVDPGDDGREFNRLANVRPAPTVAGPDDGTPPQAPDVMEQPLQEPQQPAAQQPPQQQAQQPVQQPRTTRRAPSRGRTPGGAAPRPPRRSVR